MDVWGLVVTGAALAVSYLLRFVGRPGSPWLGTALKTLSVAALALAGWRAGAPGLIVAGLALGALGDFALSRQGERWFLAGMAAFGLGHVAYAAAFWTGDPGPWWAMAALLSLAFSTEVWLAPNVGALLQPVRLYVGVITAMGIAALCLPPGAVLLGAGLFLLSDAALALDRFALDHPPRWLGRAVWSLYWSGQALILIGHLPTGP